MAFFKLLEEFLTGSPTIVAWLILALFAANLILYAVGHLLWNLREVRDFWLIQSGLSPGETAGRRRLRMLVMPCQALFLLLLFVAAISYFAAKLRNDFTTESGMLLAPPPKCVLVVHRFRCNRELAASNSKRGIFGLVYRSDSKPVTFRVREPFDVASQSRGRIPRLTVDHIGNKLIWVAVLLDKEQADSVKTLLPDTYFEVEIEFAAVPNWLEYEIVSPSAKRRIREELKLRPGGIDGVVGCAGVDCSGG